MARSQKVAPEYLENVNSALKRNGYPSKSKFAEHVTPSLSTVKNFFAGKPVDFEYFVEICEKLGLDWQEISYDETLDETSQKDNNPPMEETSPFITGSPIKHPSRFFGRQKELKRLFGILKRHPLQNAAIIGKRRMGKTSLLHYLKNITVTAKEELRPEQKSDWLPHPEVYKWIFVDFQDSRMASRENLLTHILENLNLKVPTPCDLDNFMDVVSDNLQNPTVILLDEIGAVLQRCEQLDDEFWESLRSLATNHTRGNLAFILTTDKLPTELALSTGHSSPFFNIFGYTAYLKEFTESEVRELIASSPIAFPEDDVEWILRESRCVPLLLQILCSERLFSLEEGESGEEWKQEGLLQMKPFIHLLDKS